MGKRTVAGSVALTAAVALLLPMGVADAHSFDVTPHVEMSKTPSGGTEPGQLVELNGDIDSRALCRQGRTVALIEIRKGADRTIDMDRSNDRGRFAFQLHPQDDLDVYARIRRIEVHTAGHDHVCRLGISNRVSIVLVEE
jgi:hypothetical protein